MKTVVHRKCAAVFPIPGEIAVKAARAFYKVWAAAIQPSCRNSLRRQRQQASLVQFAASRESMLADISFYGCQTNFKCGIII